MKKGFTLLELSIVLTILGLLGGAVLAGQALIRAGEIRSVVNQQQQYALAATTFRLKYDDYLPGDIPPSLATKFGLFTFTGPNAGGQGFGNGDGTIQASSFIEFSDCGGECGAFWRHLSDAGLISRIGDAIVDDTTLAYAGAVAPVAGVHDSAQYLPAMKLGNGFISVGNTYAQQTTPPSFAGFYGVESFFALQAAPTAAHPSASPILAPADAFAIEGKIDDGNPNVGNVLVNQLDYSAVPTYGAWWAAAAADGKCTHGGATWDDPVAQYNLDEAVGAGTVACMLLIRMR